MADASDAITCGWETIADETEGPGLRSRHGLVFDRKAKATVLFGGIIWSQNARLMSDTWELKNRCWTRISTRRSPAPRHRFAMVHMNSHGKSLMFAGQDDRHYIRDDTWIYQDREWHRLRRIIGPQFRFGHSMAFDENEGVAVLFGGGGEAGRDGKSLRDTWFFDGRRWRQMQGRTPPERRYAAFAYDPDLGGCLLHGGSVDEGSRPLGDAWLLRKGKWTFLGDRFSTDCRDDHGLGYHRAARRLVMLEGVGGRHGTLIRDVAGWRTIPIEPEHPRHQCSPMAWDENLNALVIHGGETHHQGSQYSETLALHLPEDV